MTRRDYLLLAQAMYRARPLVNDYPARTPQAQQWGQCVQELAQAIGARNPRFDQQQFMRNCRLGTQAAENA